MLWGRFADETFPYAVSVDVINDQVSPENVVIEANMETKSTLPVGPLMKQAQREAGKFLLSLISSLLTQRYMAWTVWMQLHTFAMSRTDRRVFQCFLLHRRLRKTVYFVAQRHIVFREEAPRRFPRACASPTAIHATKLRNPFSDRRSCL
jgi:hypothetical protein